MPRVLIADDQIPDNELLSDQDVRDHYSTLYGQDADGREFIEGFVFLRKLTLLLRDRGYDVDCANTPAAVLHLATHNTYDAIILDLGWYTVENMSYDDRMRYGFSIADQIRQHSSAPILMFSNRFPERNDLAETAAGKGLLPVYKSDDEACKLHLLVAMKWVMHGRTLADRLREEQKMHALRMYRLLSYVLVIAIAAGVILLGTTTIAVVIRNGDLTLASSLFGIVSSFISVGIYRYVSEYEKSIA